MTIVQVPGRVNLIGDHTDYTGGLVFPMAIDRYTTIECEDNDDAVQLSSSSEDGVVEFLLGDPFDSQMTPRWGRYVAAVASLLDSPRGIRGTVDSTIPVGAGLSSSASLEIASALALGAHLPPRELALLTQKAEQLATGVPTGIMDQLCIASASPGCGTLIDCHSLDVTHVQLPDDVHIVVKFIAHRTLEGSEYSERVRECSFAEEMIGPLRLAEMGMLARISDPVVHKRALHVISENHRVLKFIDALRAGDYVRAGQLMVDSHESLSNDFETSNKAMDAAVYEAVNTAGVFGARMTGGGFGGCVVMLCEPSAPVDGWRVQPSGGPTIN